MNELENPFNYNNTNQTEQGQIDCEVIKKLAEEIEKKSVLQKICFSKEQSELKEKYYKAFNELPKAENTTMFGGVQIVEEDILPANTMVWRFTNPVDNRIFIYREGRLYELPRINLFGDFKPISL